MNEKLEILKSIDNKLTGIIRLLAQDSLEDLSSKDKIKRLYRMKLSPKEIAQTLGKTSNNVRTQLSQMRGEGELDD